MRYDPRIHHRRSIRLKTWDYAASGAYFITICAEHRREIFGHVVDDEMVLNPLGECVTAEWLRSAEIRAEAQLDESILMPNHLHAIVFLTNPISEPVEWHPRTFCGSPPRSLSSLVQGFKSATTRRVNEARRTPGAAVWQEGFHDRVVRNDRELDRAREYIRDNPRKWAEDKNNPANWHHPT